LRHRFPGVTTLPGRAESIPLPDASVDAVLAGQAAHWFELDLAMPEITRVLTPGGVLAGLWNADDDREDWIASLHRVSGRASTLSLSAVRESSDSDGITDWLATTGPALYWPLEHAGFEHSQLRTADSLIETMRTHSMFLIMESAEREATLARVRDFLAATPQTASGEFSLPIYTLAVRAARR
jgi:SAM-dependent methyltransferase